MQELVTKTDLREAVLSLTIRLGSIVAASIGIIAVLIRFHA
jgi:hypothetical protein